MKSNTPSFLSDADSVTLVIHGVGDHSGQDILLAAHKGFSASDISSGFDVKISDKTVLPRTRKDEYPWAQEGSICLSNAGSKHVVLPCVWSGTRIASVTAYTLLGISLAYVLLLGTMILVKTYLESWDYHYFWILAGAVILDLAGAKKVNGRRVNEWLITKLVGAFGLIGLVIGFSYPYLSLLPALALFGLGVTFAIPPIRTVPQARNLGWQCLIILVASGMVALLTSAGLALGSFVALGAELFENPAARGWSAFLALSAPLAVCAFLGIGIRLSGVLVLIELANDVTRYLGMPRWRSRRVETFYQLLSDVKEKSPNATIQIVSHSLGTVLVSHALASAEHSREIKLVTMGSPLSFMSKVFPKTVQSPESLARGFALNKNVFSWLNLWRDRDPVGRALGVTRSLFNERSLGPGGHANYWSDARTWNAIAASLTGHQVKENIISNPSLFSRIGGWGVGFVTAGIWLAAILIWPPETTNKGRNFPDMTPRGDAEIDVRLFPGNIPAAGVFIEIDGKTKITQSDGRVVFSRLRANRYSVNIPSQEIFSPGGLLQNYQPRQFVPDVVVKEDSLERGTINNESHENIDMSIFEDGRATVYLDAWMEVSGRVVNVQGIGLQSLVLARHEFSGNATENGVFLLRKSIRSFPLTIEIKPLGVDLGEVIHERVVPLEDFGPGNDCWLGDIEISTEISPAVPVLRCKDRESGD